ncbi:MarR family protein [Sphingomonas rubra]|uniref:MarR family protein n=2 Tax=Sphingomonas rubra TaxID=634430 RepID=A0A1I5PZV4_9SPHN|nr:MarR family protein [Sphingomonas rubra]
MTSETLTKRGNMPDAKALCPRNESPQRGPTVGNEPVATHDPQTLSIWMTALVDYVRSGEPDLTNRQMALLLLVYLKPGPHTVRGLARALNVSKPVVTRALNRLGALGYLRRQRDDSDKRNIFVARTSEGADFLEEFGQFIGDGEPQRPPLRHAAA